MSATEIAACVGATTGTLALILEIVKWLQSGARLTISTNANMVPVDPTKDFPPEPHLMVWVPNVGEAPTTITALGLEYYPNRWFQLIRRRGEHGLIPKPAGEPLPRALQPGEQWSTIVKRGSPVEKAKEGWRTRLRRIPHDVEEACAAPCSIFGVDGCQRFDRT